MKFEGGGVRRSGPVAVGPQPQRIGAPMTVEDVPIMQLDLFATGALPDDEASDERQARPASTNSLSPATFRSSGWSMSPTAAP